MKQRWLWCLLAIVLLAGIAWVLRPRDEITRATYDKIRLGMTLDEVEAIIGAPGLDLHEASRIATEKRRLRWIRVDKRLQEGTRWDWDNPEPDLSRLRLWQKHLSVLSVHLGEDGRVIGKDFEERHRQDILHEIYTWFGW